jgi:hypothetical protein
MAKASGIGWTTLNVDDVTGAATDLKNDCTNLQFATPRAASDITGLNMTAIERLLLLADFSMTLNGQHNPAGSHAALKHVTSSAIVRSVALGVNSCTLTNEVLFSDYSLVRAQGGDLNWSAAAALADGTPPTWGP